MSRWHQLHLHPSYGLTVFFQPVRFRRQPRRWLTLISSRRVKAAIPSPTNSSPSGSAKSTDSSPRSSIPPQQSLSGATDQQCSALNLKAPGRGAFHCIVKNYRITLATNGWNVYEFIPYLEIKDSEKKITCPVSKSRVILLIFFWKDLPFLEYSIRKSVR